MAQAAAPADIDLSKWADEIYAAREKNMSAQLVSQDPDGYPDVSYKGSMMVFDKDHLAWWERSLGESLAQYEKNAKVAVTYRNNETRVWLRFYGVAEVHKDDAVRQQIMDRTVQVELDADPERKGFGVLMRVDRVRLARNSIQERKGVL